MLRSARRFPPVGTAAASRHLSNARTLRRPPLGQRLVVPAVDPSLPQRLRARIGEAAARPRATVSRAVGGFIEDRAPQSAAAISYYALFSLFPLAILAVVAFGLVIDDASARARVIDFVLANLPLQQNQGRRELENVLTSVTQGSRGFGLAGALGLVIAASGVMGAIRHALNRAWDVQDTRPLVQAKIVDVLLVLGLGLLIALSFALTLVARLAASLSAELEQAPGPVGSAVAQLLLGLGQVVPALVAFAVFATLFRVVPATRTRLRDVWPGAAVAAIGFEAAKTGFAIYLANFANYNAVYASLATVVAFLFFVFVTANVFLLGAAVAVEWPSVRDGGGDDGDDVPFGERLRRALISLFVRREPDASQPAPDAPTGDEAR